MRNAEASQFSIPSSRRGSSRGKKRPVPLSRPGSAQPHGRPAPGAARPGDRQSGRGSQVAPERIRRRIRRASRICSGGRSQAYRLAGLLHARQVFHQAVRNGDELRLPSDPGRQRVDALRRRSPAEDAVCGPDGHDAGLFDRPSERQGFAGHVRRAGAGHRAAQQLDGAGRADDRTPGHDRAGPKDPVGRMSDRAGGPDASARDRHGVQRLLHRSGRTRGGACSGCATAGTRSSCSR